MKVSTSRTSSIGSNPGALLKITLVAKTQEEKETLAKYASLHTNHRFEGLGGEKLVLTNISQIDHVDGVPLFSAFAPVVAAIIKDGHDLTRRPRRPHRGPSY